MVLTYTDTIIKSYPVTYSNKYKTNKSYSKLNTQMWQGLPVAYHSWGCAISLFFFPTPRSRFNTHPWHVTEWFH